MMQKIALPASLLLLLTSPAMAQSFHNGDVAWGVRLTSTAPSRTAVSGVEFSFARTSSVEFSARQELDNSLFAELSITTPSGHALTEYRPGSNSTLQSAKLTLLPISLLGNLILVRLGDFDIYGGAGVNLTHLSLTDDRSPAWLLARTLSTGVALQAGIDYTTDWGWKFNLNVRKTQTNATLRLEGKLTEDALDLNPWAIGAGLSYRF